MKTIEERAKEYSISCFPNMRDMQFACEMHFEAGAEWMYKELTRWHDPEEQPEDGCICLLKFQSNGFFVHYEGGIFTKKDGEWHDSQNMFTYNRDAILAWRPMHN